MRSRSIFVFALFCLVALASPAGALEVRWKAEGGMKFTDVARAPDGALYVSGTDRRSITAAATLRKFSPTGDLLWMRHWLPSVQDSTGGEGVAVGQDGTVYLLGSVHGSCEGGGWFIRAYTPGGTLRWKYVTPGWQCSIAEVATDIAVGGDAVAVSGYSHGCCGDPYHDGWVQTFSRNLTRRWRANVEPPVPAPAAWFDTATGVGIGGTGNVFVSGWAATAAISDDGSPMPGTPFLAKLTEHGARLWSQRAEVSMPTMYQEVPLTTHAGRVVIAAAIEGRGVEWGMNPTAAWVGSYTTGGALEWERRWGGGRDDAVAPYGVSLNFAGRVWVSATRRDPADRGTDVVVRAYGSRGALLEWLRIDPPHRYLWSAGVASMGRGVAATGWVGHRFVANGGRLWRLAAA